MKALIAPPSLGRRITNTPEWAHMTAREKLGLANALGERLARLIAEITGIEVEVCVNTLHGALINVLVLDSQNTKRVAQLIKKFRKSLKLVKIIEYEADQEELNSTPSTLLIFDEK